MSFFLHPCLEAHKARKDSPKMKLDDKKGVKHNNPKSIVNKNKSSTTKKASSIINIKDDYDNNNQKKQVRFRKSAMKVKTTGTTKENNQQKATNESSRINELLLSDSYTNTESYSAKNIQALVTFRLYVTAGFIISIVVYIIYRNYFGTFHQSSQ
jgi:hypothetical protein